MTEEPSDLTSIIQGILEVFQINEGIDSVVGTGIDAAIVTAMITSTASIILGIAAYFIKRVFTKKDYENQQNIEHSVWLLKKTHEVAVRHYVLLTRHLFNSEVELKRADLSCDSILIENAYDKISDLIRQYDQFQKDTGANILFLERRNENKAIGKINSLFMSLPFDYDDRLRIINKDNEFAKNSFRNWLNSKNCSKSKAQAKKRLYESRSIFDDETEKILHHEYFLKSRKSHKIKSLKERMKKIHNLFKKSIPDSFFIDKISPIYVVKGEKVWLFGSGFTDKSIKYSLKIGNKTISHTPKDNELTQMIIPTDLNEGTYDVTADFTINEIQGDEPTGLVVHIVKQEFLSKRASLPKPSAIDTEITKSDISSTDNSKSSTETSEIF
jgi:hypothetical protein